MTDNKFGSLIRKIAQVPFTKLRRSALCGGVKMFSKNAKSY